MFRRALEARDEAAWDAVYRQYAPLAAGWASQHPALAAGANGDAYLAWIEHRDGKAGIRFTGTR